MEYEYHENVGIIWDYNAAVEHFMAYLGSKYWLKGNSAENPDSWGKKTVFSVQIFHETNPFSDEIRRLSLRNQVMNLKPSDYVDKSAGSCSPSLMSPLAALVLP